MGEGLCSPSKVFCSFSFAGITNSSPTEAFPQALAASLGKDGFCGWFALELMVDATQDSSSASPVSMGFFSPRLSRQGQMFLMGASRQLLSL